MKRQNLLLLLSLGFLLIIAFLVYQSFFQPKKKASVSEPIQYIKLVRHLADGRDETTEFDCGGIMTKTIPTGDTSKQQKMQVSQKDLKKICDLLNTINFADLKDNYGGGKPDFTLTVVTANGEKTISFSLDSPDTPDVLRQLVENLEQATGTIILSPTPFFSQEDANVISNTPTPTRRPANQTATPTPFPSITPKTNPTIEPLPCNFGAIEGQAGRPLILSNTVCTP